MQRRHTHPIHHYKAAPSGVIEGYGSTFGNRDLAGDVIEAGAFRESLDEHKAAGTSPAMLWGHDPSNPIGRWDSFAEDARGLHVRGRLTMTVTKAREAFDLAREGALALSIGFHPTDIAPDGDVNRIRAVRLHEVSLVGLPANPQARVTAVKAAAGIDTLPAYERFLADSLGISRREAARLATKGWQAYRGESAELNDILDALESSAQRFRR